MKGKMFRASVIVAIALGALAVAAPAFAAGSTTTTVPRQKALTAYRSCMKAHGVKLPASPFRPGGANGAAGGSGGPGANGAAGESGGPGANGGARGGFGNANFVPSNLPKGVTAKKYLAARKACAGKLPASGFGGQNSTQIPGLPELPAATTASRSPRTVACAG